MLSRKIIISATILHGNMKDSFVAPSISVIKNSNIFQKNSLYAKIFLSKQLSIIDYYILTKSITSHNKKSPQKSLYTQQKSFLHWQGVSTYQYSQLTKLFLISRNMNYPRKNLIYLKKIYTFSPTRRNSKIRNLHHL